MRAPRTTRGRPEEDEMEFYDDGCDPCDPGDAPVDVPADPYAPPAGPAPVDVGPVDVAPAPPLDDAPSVPMPDQLPDPAPAPFVAPEPPAAAPVPASAAPTAAAAIFGTETTLGGDAGPGFTVVDPSGHAASGPLLGDATVGGTAEGSSLVWVDDHGAPTAAPQVAPVPGSAHEVARLMSQSADASLAGGILRTGEPAPWVPGGDADHDGILNQNDTRPTDPFAP